MYISCLQVLVCHNQSLHKAILFCSSQQVQSSSFQLPKTTWLSTHIIPDWLSTHIILDWLSTHIIPDWHALRILVHQPVCDVPVVVVDCLVQKTCSILVLQIVSAFYPVQNQSGCESFLSVKNCWNHTFRSYYQNLFNICKKKSWIWKGTFDRANLALPSIACTSLRLPWATAAWRASIFCMYLPTTSSPAPQEFDPKDLPWDSLQKLAHFRVRGILWQQFVTLVSTY